MVAEAELLVRASTEKRNQEGCCLARPLPQDKHTSFSAANLAAAPCTADDCDHSE